MTCFSQGDVRVATSLLTQTLGWLWRGVRAAHAGCGYRGGFCVLVVAIAAGYAPQLRGPVAFLRAGCYATSQR
ncbi:MAG: hypothetical protein Ta2A_04240 [Treponemataceae bacterium]|nr:MAG: hypothetical protein Ta2A_04240 [Treponemataceae bacterium]